MKKHLLVLLLLSICISGKAQNATDFTANDCSGNSHNLFSELDAGKVIVLCWVMPCGLCTGPSTTTNNVVQSYQASHPNTVFFYMCDDYANSSCASINSWANSIGIPQSASSLRFSNAAINMNDYGSTGMPKIVVLGGTDHTVFYNANNTVNATALQNAINTALTATGIDDVKNNIASINIAPNPVVTTTEIKFNVLKPSYVNIELFNTESKKLKAVYSGNMTAGEQTIPMDVSGYSPGIYLLKVSDGIRDNYVNIVVTH